MTASTVVTLILLVILLLFSAFFSASETAFTSISKGQYRRLRKSRNKKDKGLVSVLSRPSRMLSSLLVGNNLVNIFASSIATAFAISLVGEDGIGYATLIMTILILIFAESTPKLIAAEKPVAVAKKCLRPFRIIQVILTPLSVIFSAINSGCMAVLKRLFPNTGLPLSEDEIKTLISVGRKDGVLEEVEHTLLSRAFDFTDLTLREIMTPRTAIIAIKDGIDQEEIKRNFQQHRFSRMPVYSDTFDSIIGMIHYKDVLFLPNNDTDHSVRDLIRPVLFVPETQTAFTLLREMKQHNQNMAIVVDEHGSTSGLITMDDAITAVFGGIHDEYDENASDSGLVRIYSPDHILVPGNLKLRELNALFKTNFTSDYYETVGGFILEKANKLPKAGDVYVIGGTGFRIEEISNRKIDRIDIKLHYSILNGS